MKLLLKNARIYDGTGAAARHGDVLVDNDRIAQVGAELPVDGADQVIDLQGLSLAPGFIDAHSHNDWFALRSDPLPWFDPFIRQGITTKDNVWNVNTEQEYHEAKQAEESAQ